MNSSRINNSLSSAILALFLSSLLISGNTGNSLKVGLALSGGGAKGMAHIGVLKVLEESGIRIDCITGTSMGSFIGGLYSIGYSAEMIEDIVLDQNWRDILRDAAPRSTLSMEEKESSGRYISEFPIRDGRIGLPESLIPGQKLTMEISRLAWPVNHVDDFDHLPIPFRCLTTDLVTGEAVVQNSGYLPDAIRASMSFPSYLAPVEIDGRLLIDGGVVRNLPVIDAINMGADIIIAVDVGAPLHWRDELTSVVAILEQTAGFLGHSSTMEQRRFADILILPDISDFSKNSFDEIEDLIASGESAARAVMPELLAAAEKQNPKPSDVPRFIPSTNRNPVYVTDVRIEGADNVSYALIHRSLDIEPPAWVSPAELETAVSRVFGTRMMKKVSYKFEPQENGVILVVRLTEGNINQFKFGIHYDSDLKSAILLNTTIRNVGTRGSKLSIDAKLGENPEVTASFIHYTNLQMGIGWASYAAYSNFTVPITNEDDHQIASFDYTNYSLDTRLQTFRSCSSSIGIGSEIMWSRIDPLIIPAEWIRTVDYENTWTYYGFLLIDTFDRSVYPSEGMQLNFRGTNAQRFSWSAKRGLTFSETFWRLHLNSKNYVPLNRLTSLFGELFLGKLDGEEPADDFYFYVGGQNGIEDNVIPFIGIRFMSLSAREIMMVQCGIQREVFPDLFVILKGGIGRREYDYADDYAVDNIALSHRESEFHGYGLTVGYDSPIGPLEISLMGSNLIDKPLTYFNIGFSF